MNDDCVAICPTAPGWRWAIGPDDRSMAPALPFYRKKSAREFYEYMKEYLASKDYPPPRIYKRIGWNTVMETNHID